MTTRDPLSPQWEDCKVCGGDHWTKDHPAPTRDTPEADAIPTTKPPMRLPTTRDTPEAEPFAVMCACPDCDGGCDLLPPDDDPICDECSMDNHRPKRDGDG
jgi:hypothetical protein